MQVIHPKDFPVGKMEDIKAAALAEMGHNMPPVDEQLKLALSDDEQDVDAILKVIREDKESEAAELDMDKSADRDALRAIAASVPRIKSGVEAHKKSLTEEWRKKTATVNARGKTIAEGLDAIKADVRLPLTTWEAQEEKRKSKIATVLAGLDPVAARADRTIEGLEAKIVQISAIQIGEEFGRQFEAATAKKAETLRLLNEDLAEARRLAEQERELAEMKAKLAEAEREKAEAQAKAAEAERQRIEAEQREAREKEARERQAREAKEREEARIQRQKIAEEERANAEKERKRREKLEAEQAEAAAKALTQMKARITGEIAQAIDGQEPEQIAAMIVNGDVPHVEVKIDLQ